MVTHADIVARNGADAELALRLRVKSHRVRDWRLRDSIPSEMWQAFAEGGLATLEELAEAAAQKPAKEARVSSRAGTVQPQTRMRRVGS